ncbi:hypothetical protein HBA54_27640 [Pelagibius litoralis]|uniref:Uncharacterized protein n=1 Tax=Pelagibius litoralis TaxID=374515 RepID=A0A967F3W6_9PROT|nr:hypothetical protein [Pelagibius litoralis]NIA72366.1 hypothetical protein [Pelagibius litoralis]
MNVSINRLSDLGKTQYIAVFCGNWRCERHSMGVDLDIPATIKRYGDLEIMKIGQTIDGCDLCDDRERRPWEIRIGHRLPKSQARGWVSGLKA